MTAEGEVAGPAAWLVGGAADRARFADMHRRFSAAPVYGLLVGGSNCLAAFLYDWRLLALVAVASLTMALGIAEHRRSRIPEVPAAATFALLQVNQLVAVGLTGGVHSPLLPLTLVPLFTQAVCFRPRISAIATGATAVTAIAVSAAATALPLRADAPLYLHLTVYLAVLGCLGLAAHHIAGSDSDARGTASLDALTGVFNRRALSNHFADTQARADVQQTPIGMIMLDLDHFKTVNDTYGHDRGDDVLREVAHRLTAAARVGDLVYRVGGEEFVVLAPGADAKTCLQIAEGLRQAVRGNPVCGLSLTVSAGACSRQALDADLVGMSHEADQALYTAKRDGRDRVALAGVGCVAPAASTAPAASATLVIQRGDRDA